MPPKKNLHEILTITLKAIWTQSHTYQERKIKILPKMPVFCFVGKNNDNTIRGKQYFLQLHLQFPHLAWSVSVDLALLLL